MCVYVCVCCVCASMNISVYKKIYVTLNPKQQLTETRLNKTTVETKKTERAETLTKLNSNQTKETT